MPIPVHKFVLKNGVRVVCESVEYVESVAVGIWCHNGSRLESEDEGGISHLIEHMLFKGTQTRTAEQIVQEVEGRGGHLNAFTDREQTCYYARVLADDLGQGVEVLGDMYLNSVIEPSELELEKGVVQEEIRKYQDSPEEMVHDLHAQKRWGHHPLGRPIIGTLESVGSFTREKLKDYVGRRYVAGKTLVAAAGKLNPETLRDICEHHLGALSGDFDLPDDPAPAPRPGENLVKKDTEQVHFCVGGDCVNQYDERRHAAALLDAVLGGSMSSRLFQEIREKRGLAYAIGSYAALFREAGAFTVYGGTSRGTFEQVRELTAAELEKVRTDPVPSEELERAKRMIRGSIVMSLESMSGRMRRIARNEMIQGRDVPVEETLAKIDAVTPKDLQDLANEYLRPEELTTTAIGPF